MPFVKRGRLLRVPPEEFSACTAVTLGDARDDSMSDPKKIVTKLHVSWGHVSANQSKRELVDPDGGMSHLVKYADEVPENCDA